MTGGSICALGVRIRTSLESCTRRTYQVVNFQHISLILSARLGLTKRHSNICIPESVEIRISGRLDNLSGISIRYWNATPFLKRVPVCGSCGIEKPISCVAYESFYLLNV
jgi:hypothetical protein